MEQSGKISLGQVFGFLWKSFQFMDGQKGRYVLGAVCSFIELGTVYLMPLFISRMIAVIQEGASLWPLMVIFVLFLVAAPLIAMGNYWMGTASYHGLCNMKKAVFAHMQQLPMSSFDGKASGEYLSRVSIDADKAGGMFRGYAIVGLFKFCVYETVGIFVLSLTDFRLIVSQNKKHQKLQHADRIFHNHQPGVNLLRGPVFLLCPPDTVLIFLSDISLAASRLDHLRRFRKVQSDVHRVSHGIRRFGFLLFNARADSVRYLQKYGNQKEKHQRQLPAQQQAGYQ